MKQTLILLLSLMIVLCAAGCGSSSANLETTGGTSLSTSILTSAPTAQLTPPSTTVPPAIGETCPPVEGDLYWGEFRGKVFKNPNGLDAPIRNIILYADGSCECQLAISSSNWDPTTEWTFDGEYLYIGSIISGRYSTFLYVGAEDPNESKLIFVKSNHDFNDFDRLPDGQEFIFSGIIRYRTEAEPSIPPTTQPSINPTCPPVEGDIYWGMYAGKYFWDYTIYGPMNLALYSDGTFALHYRSHVNKGIWTLEDDLLYLIGLDENGNENGYISCFQYIPAESDVNAHLVFVKGSNDLPNLSECEDGTIFEGVVLIKNP